MTAKKGGEKKICCSIMICQMTAILSGVALMYLSVIVIIPSMRELNYKFNENPIMCTTVKAIDLSAGGEKVDCPWVTCGEWCLSKTSTPCMQIHVMPRLKGASIDLEQCDSVTEDVCSAINVTLTNERLCKKGECKDMSGMFNCTKAGENSCRDISLAYNCTGNSLRAINRTVVKCDEKKCGSRLEGVYLCLNGECNKIEDKRSYKDCERKCENLNLKKANVILATKDRLYSAKCDQADLISNDSLSDLNGNIEWKRGTKVLTLYCSEVLKTIDEQEYTNFKLSDCFNVTLRNYNEVTNIKSFLKLDNALRTPSSSVQDTLIGNEEELRIMNDTKLLINSQGCVNTLIKECKAFFDTHATDGRDGQTSDRFPCYYTNNTQEFVIGKYESELTYLYMMLASFVPSSLFVISCFCLFVCSKSVSVDNNGQLKVTLLKKNERKASEL